MMRRCLRILKALAYYGVIAAAGSSSAQQTSDRVETACVSCHRAESESQPNTPMGRALLLPGRDSPLDGIPKISVRKGPYTYTVESHDGKGTYTVTDGAQTITLPIPWNFGAGAQTWVLERNGKRYESTVSFYPAIRGLDYTTGDEDLQPKNLEESIGREITVREAKVCFGCHASNTISNGALTLGSLRPGVTCEHCHANSMAHLSDSFYGEFRTAPPSLGKLSSEEISNFCGQCHRTWETVVRNHWRGELTVRFQPYRLANSKCFDGADRRISCISCHNPHKNLVRDDSSYDRNCLACHSSSASSANQAAGISTKLCPVAKANCVSCHMPKVKLPNGHLTFTDHQIRIVKAGEPFPD